ncbi:MAG TPA: hypothetical protein VM451_04155 [Candidatus Limnocylindria bacterium]|nr:hypothetical protein [Candidatus Limnocylindria bacterium]
MRAGTLRLTRKVRTAVEAVVQEHAFEPLAEIEAARAAIAGVTRATERPPSP